MSTSTVQVVVIIGAGSMGQAIALRIGVGKTILLADLNEEAARAAANTLQAAGFTTSIATVDVASHDSVRALVETAAGLGDVAHVVHRRPCRHTRRDRSHRSISDLLVGGAISIRLLTQSIAHSSAALSCLFSNSNMRSADQ